MLGHLLVSLVLGVASPPLRTFSTGVSRPAVRAPKPPPTTSAPVPLASVPEVVESLQGEDLVQSPNVFRGISPSGRLLEQPLPLGREEELEVRPRPSGEPEALTPRCQHCSAWIHTSLRLLGLPCAHEQLVSRAIFFIASTDAQRTLAEADGEEIVFGHEELLAQMRATARANAAIAKAAKSSGKSTATEVPCQVPEALTAIEFRLRQALGRAAYNKLFLHNQKLIYYEVNKVWPSWGHATVIEKADFLQEGAQGLLRAIRLFDTTRGVRFSTYATWHVRAFVLRALRDKSHIVRLPQMLQADMQMIKKGRYRYAVENQGLLPSDAALADLLQWPLSRVESALQGLASASATSLDAEPMGVSKGGDSAHGQSLHSRLPCAKHDSAAAENEVYRLQLRHTLKVAMQERDPRRIEITRLKYGLEDGVEWTYPQLAERFNTTANVAKGIVRSEVAFLRRAKKRVLQDFVDHVDDH